MSSALAIALVVTVLLHGMIIYLFATHKIATSAASVPPILVTFIDKPPRPAVQLTIPAVTNAQALVCATSCPDF
jgi:hypothetical protein